MRRVFPSLAEFERTVVLFEDRLNLLDPAHKNFLLVSNADGEAVSSLNDLVRVEGMKTMPEGGVFGILHYFTSLNLPPNIKEEVKAIFDELFYDAE